MKKTAFLFGMALAMVLPACDDMLPNPEPASFPELATFAASDLTIEQSNSGESVIDLQALADAGERVELGRVTKIENFPATYNLAFRFEVSNTEDFAKTTSFDADVEGDKIVAPTATVNNAIYDNFTHDPAQVKLYTRVAAYAEQGTSVMRLGGADYLYGTFNYNVKPFAPAAELVYDYYLMYKPAGAAQWQNVKFVKAVDGSVYDDGKFTVTVDVPAGGIEWTIGVGSYDGKSTLNPTPAEGKDGEGKLTPAGTPAPIALSADAESPYLITIDVVNNTYSAAMAFEYLYVPGGATGVGNFNAALKLFSRDYVNYEGTMRLYNTFYFTAQPSDKGYIYLPDGDVTVADNGTMTANILVANELGENTTFSASNGLYYIKVNISTLKVAVTPVASIQLIGDFNNWDTATALELKSASRFRSWSIKGVNLKAGQGFKFCVDHDWALSYGGAIDNLEQNGGNLSVDEDGTYDITIDFSKQPNTVKLVKK